MKFNINTTDTWQRYERILREYILSLRDVRNLGMLVFVVIVLLISWSGAKAIQTNFQLDQEVEKLHQQNAVLKLQTSNQRLENNYYTTSQYLEVTARQNLGLAAPGETELLVPKEVALRNTIPLPDAAPDDAAKNKPLWQENFETWVDFFFHRSRNV